VLIPSSADPALSMIARPIPASGETLPVVGLGTYQSFDAGTSAQERELLTEVLQLFLQRSSSIVRRCTDVRNP